MEYTVKSKLGYLLRMGGWCKQKNSLHIMFFSDYDVTTEVAVATRENLGIPCMVMPIRRVEFQDLADDDFHL